MKFNFWQILGLILLVLGAIGIIYEKFLAPADHKPATRPATTLPLAA